MHQINMNSVWRLLQFLQMKNINMAQDSLGVYIPSKELKSRNKFNWMLYLSPMEVLESKTFIGKHLSQSI